MTFISLKIAMQVGALIQISVILTQTVFTRMGLIREELDLLGVITLKLKNCKCGKLILTEAKGIAGTIEDDSLLLILSNLSTYQNYRLIQLINLSIF